MKKSLRLLAAMLALLLLAAAVSSCASQGKTLIVLEKDGVRAEFPVTYYELMLSRWKGSLVAGNYSNNGYNAEQDGFYDLKDKFDGTNLQTLGEYYAQLILDNCKNFTAVLWMFESLSLSLSAEQIAAADEKMSDALSAYGDGSKAKLNAVLANYGVNYDMLRNVYLMEAKVDAVQNALYGKGGSLLGYEVKEQFLAENYVHFKQIFLPFFRYVYKTDANGDEIYYVKDAQNGAIAYDTNMFAGKDEKGLPITDANGDTVYYTSAEQVKIAYDTKNGIRSFVLDKNGEATTTDMTADEIKAVTEKGEALFASLQNCTVAEFEAKLSEVNMEVGEETHADGIYLQKNLDYAGAGSDFAYFTDIINAMDAMENGAIAKITTDASGYHIVMKYAPTEKAYENAANEAWFQNFTSALMEELFMDECEKLFPEMKVNTEVLATAADIKRIGANLYF